jgi:hypothetical protein
MRSGLENADGGYFRRADVSGNECRIRLLKPTDCSAHGSLDAKNPDIASFIRATRYARAGFQKALRHDDDPAMD